MSDELIKMSKIAAKAMSGAAASMGGTNPTPMAARDVIEILVMSIRAGDYRPPKYRRMPPHLPVKSGELYRLKSSQGREDAPLRRDISEWMHANQEAQSRGGYMLSVCAGSILDADKVLDSAEDGELAEWRDEIARHVVKCWGVTVQPMERAGMYRWALGVAGRGNPVPRWLANGEQPRDSFDPGAP